MAEDLRQFIHQLKETVDIVDLVGRFTQLKRSGQSFKACCPFHQEKTPSFHVIPQKKIFHCFGCGAGGSVVDFVMRHERLEFLDAIKWLAKDNGMELPETRHVDPEVRKRRQNIETLIFNANEEALKWFRRNLLEKRNPVASDYLPRRGLSDEISEKFQLGASLDEWDGLRRHLNKLGFSDDLLITGGLCATNDRGNIYDRFVNRLIFPIWDTNNRVVGFGGRRLDDDRKDSPKYLNTAETPVYHKGKVLYALNLAQPDLIKSGFTILCEGYMDVITAHANGFPQAVASLGTALTPEQSKQLKRFAPRAYFLYDGDDAGQKAMLGGGQHLLAADIDARVIVLPEGQDPDDFLKESGVEALQKRIDQAVEFFDYAVQAHQKTLNLLEMRGQAELVERLAPLLEITKNDAMREASLGRLARKTPLLPRDVIERILARKKAKELERERLRQQYAKGENPREAPEEEDLGADAFLAKSSSEVLMERRLLKIILENKEALQYVRQHLQHDWVLETPFSQWIFYFSDHEGYAERLIDDLHANGEYPANSSYLYEIMAWDVPSGGCTVNMAMEVLLLMQERHQSTLARYLFELIEGRQLSDEDMMKLVKAFHTENKNRITNVGSKIRTGDAEARRSRLGR